MKSVLIALIMIPLLQDANLESITKALSVGDMNTLSSYMDERVEIAVKEEGKIYVKREAIAKLQQFFASNRPASFHQMHKGSSPGKESMYCIGNLITNGQNFRVYLYIKVHGGQYFIQEMRFDLEQ